VTAADADLAPDDKACGQVESAAVWIAVHVVLGVACLALAGVLVFRRDAMLAFHRRRGRDTTGMPWGLMAAFIAVIGLTQLFQALR
jgi:uncharacterized membrane protein YhaH (DUF805 family)